MDEQNKDSLFAGLVPQAPASPAGLTGHTEPIAALTRRLEAFERTVISLLEKRPPVATPHPPQGAPPAADAMLMRRLEEMENRIRDFQEKSILSAAQLKAVEGSRISGRREIEELLKAVREQQKYSELDRQMHVQLEKAWNRVEEMEKRLLEVYAASAAGQTVIPQAASISDKISAALEERLVERLGKIEEILKSVAASPNRFSAHDEPSSALEGCLEAAKELPRQGCAMSDELLRHSIALSETGARLNAVLPEIKLSTDAALKAIEEQLGQVLHRSGESSRELAGQIHDLSAVLRRAIAGISAQAGDTDRRLASLATAVSKEIASAHADMHELGVATGSRLDSVSFEIKTSTEAVVRTIEAGVGQVIQGFTEASGRLDGQLHELSAALHAEISQSFKMHIEEIRRELRIESDRQVERLNVAFRRPGESIFALAAATRTMSGIEGRLPCVVESLKILVKSMAPLNPGAVQGVSGLMMCRTYDVARGVLQSLEEDASSLSDARSSLEASLRAVADDIATAGGLSGSTDGG